MIWHRVRQIKTTEPAIGQIEMDLFAQSPFRADTHAIANQQHTDHQFWINGGATGRTVERCKKCPDIGEIDKPVYQSQQVILRNVIFNAELIKQCCLSILSWSHHRKQSPKSMEKLNQPTTTISWRLFQRNRSLSCPSGRSAFSTAKCHNQTFQAEWYGQSAACGNPAFRKPSKISSRCSASL